MIDLTILNTEGRNPNSENFSSMSIEEAVTLMNEEDLNAVKAVANAKDMIVKVIEQSSSTLQKNGRIIYCGAGTSGRLGVLDAVECPPTFGVDYNTVVGLIAGGDSAFVKAKEGAEDSRELGEQDLKGIDLTKDDMVIGLAASGRTPYVIGALEYAKSLGCATAAVVCSTDSAISKLCEHTITLLPGAEILTGSTRLKAGTATKMVLNMISTISMKSVGKIYKNYMVDVKMTNEKLRARGVNIIRTLTGCDEDKARDTLEKAENEVKTAVVMVSKDVDAFEARKLLNEANGFIDPIL
ncbi:N-acetylmuramic acid 6-phosphate etherase [Allobaculum sp. JKK-2023]|uniref:N-acetylmuramic acid 6-phosphate etherase n=1 Tax=Allobaculum sp. JKK-2023 TaxID=3108943 RepID=UPI002B057E7F|nr:N-acetylmuramic acid 6-phosphate etherase [Allobaculum sp. JKK-2023]